MSKTYKEFFFMLRIKFGLEAVVDKKILDYIILIINGIE